MKWVNIGFLGFDWWFDIFQNSEGCLARWTSALLCSFLGFGLWSESTWFSFIAHFLLRVHDSPLCFPYQLFLCLQRCISRRSKAELISCLCFSYLSLLQKDLFSWDLFYRSVLQIIYPRQTCLPGDFDLCTNLNLLLIALMLLHSLGKLFHKHPSSWAVDRALLFSSHLNTHICSSLWSLHKALHCVLHWILKLAQLA